MACLVSRFLITTEMRLAPTFLWFEVFNLYNIDTVILASLKRFRFLCHIWVKFELLFFLKVNFPLYFILKFFSYDSCSFILFVILFICGIVTTNGIDSLGLIFWVWLIAQLEMATALSWLYSRQTSAHTLPGDLFNLVVHLNVFLLLFNELK